MKRNKLFTEYRILHYAISIIVYLFLLLFILKTSWSFILTTIILITILTFLPIIYGYDSGVQIQYIGIPYFKSQYIDYNQIERVELENTTYSESIEDFWIFVLFIENKTKPVNITFHKEENAIQFYQILKHQKIKVYYEKIDEISQELIQRTKLEVKQNKNSISPIRLNYLDEFLWTGLAIFTLLLVYFLTK